MELKNSSKIGIVGLLLLVFDIVYGDFIVRGYNSYVTIIAVIAIIFLLITAVLDRDEKAKAKKALEKAKVTSAKT